MKRTGVVNGLALVLALVGSVAMAARRGEPPSAASRVDVTEHPVEARAYSRIVSASTVADRLLLELCEPDRVIAFTAASAAGPDGHRFAGRAYIERLDDVEPIVALAPDLVLLHNVADARRVERLRSAGLNVVDLGPLEGVASLPDDARRVAALCGAPPERAERYVRAWTRRLEAIARRIAPEHRHGAIYLSIYSGRFFGGTRGSSYHDVLTYAGLRDEAAARYEGWPQYSLEQLLELDPDWIVTRTGMGAAICGQPALARLSACRRGHLVEVEGDLLDAPGPGILDAAEAVHAAAYP